MAAPFDPRLLREVPQVRRPVAALGALGVASGVVAIAQAVTVARLVVALVEGRSLVGWSIAVLVVLAIRGVLSAAGEVTAAWAGTRVAGILRRRVLATWLAQPVDASPDPSMMLSRSTAGADSIEPYVARFLPALVSAAVVPVMALVALICTDWVSALIVVLTLPLLPFFAALIGMHTRDETQARWDESVTLAGHFLDVMRGLPTLVNYQRADAQVGTVAQVGDRHRRATVRTLRTAFLSSAALEMLATISVAIVAVGVGLRLTHGSITLTVGLTAILLAPEAYWPIRRVGQEFHAAADGASALDGLLVAAPAPIARSVDGAPQVTGLGYTYPGSAAPVLSDVDLTVAPGLTAITGPSGCGKSTLLELLAGLRTPTSGTVRMPTAHLVTQRAFVAPGTLRDNLIRPGASRLPEGETWLPAPLRALPRGLDTVLGDDGYGLSAGQRALLAITRARLSDAPLVLLDEPTAHLDSTARGEVLDLLSELARERRVVVVTHDPQVAARADHHFELAHHEQVQAVASTSPVVADTQQTDPQPDFHRADPHPTRQPDITDVPDATASAAALLRPAPGIVPAALLGGLAATCGVALTATSGWLIVQASTRPAVLTLLVAIVGVRTFGIGRPVLRYAERLRSHDAALRVLVGRRTRLYRSLIPLTPARLGRRRRSDLLGAAVRDVDDEVDVQVRALVPLIAAACTCAVAIVVSAAIYPPAALVTTALVLAAAAIGATDWRLERAGQRQALDARADVARTAQLVSTNMAQLQAISGGAEEMTALGRAHRTLERAVLRQVRGRAAGYGLSFLLTGAAAVGTAVVAAHGMRHAGLSAPLAALLVLGPIALTDILAVIPDAVGALARGQAARDRLARLVKQTPAVRDNGRHLELPAPHPFALRDVAASWDEEHLAVTGANLDLAPGEHLAVTGPNGAGKSTVLAVLARHLDPLAGRYDVSGRDALGISPDDVRRLLAVVDDEPHVFAGTLRANLGLARPGASDAAIGRVLVDAGLGRWLASLPDGLDTVLGADARGMSGGERARLAIARALLSRRPGILLDEPVAHLDHPTATSVMTDLHAAARDASLVIVSHQDIGISQCDRVIRLAHAPTAEGVPRDAEPTRR